MHSVNKKTFLTNKLTKAVLKKIVLSLRIWIIIECR